MTPHTAQPARSKIVLAFLAVYTIWGSTYLAIRIAIDSLPPLLMAASRFLMAGVLLGGWALATSRARPTRREWGAALLLGVLFLTLGNGGVVLAEQRVPTGLTSLLVACSPAWTVLVEWLAPGGQRPGIRTAGGLLLGFLGVALLVIPNGKHGTGVDLVGALMLTLASLSWAIGSVYAKRLPQPASPLLATGMQMLAGGGVLVVLGMLHGELGALSPAALTARSLGALLYLVVFGSIVAFTAFTFLLRHAPPAQVSTYAYVNPVVAVLLGWAIAGEPFGIRTLVAAGAILAAVVLITLDRTRLPRRTGDVMPSAPASEPPERAAA
ncbi:MAG: EamA family transporter [Gemmatimonadota bacterium]